MATGSYRSDRSSPSAVSQGGKLGLGFRVLYHMSSTIDLSSTGAFINTSRPSVWFAQQTLFIFLHHSHNFVTCHVLFNSGGAFKRLFTFYKLDSECASIPSLSITADLVPGHKTTEPSLRTADLRAVIFSVSASQEALMTGFVNIASPTSLRPPDSIMSDF